MAYFGHWIGSELSHPIRDCEAQILSLQVSYTELRCNSYKKPKWRSCFSLSDHIDSPNCVSDWTYNDAYILSTYSNVIVKHVSLVSILNYKPFHISFECRCFIKKWPQKARIPCTTQFKLKGFSVTKTLIDTRGKPWFNVLDMGLNYKEHIFRPQFLKTSNLIAKITFLLQNLEDTSNISIS